MRYVLAGGVLAALAGVGVIVPAIVDWLDKGSGSVLVLAVLALGSVLILCGFAAIGMGLYCWRGASTPSAVRVAVAVLILILAFFALETSDGLIRRGGRILYWSSFFFAPALLLLYGLLSARRWAWWVTRGVTALAVMWFLVFAVLIPFVELQGEQGPVPWIGRVYMICVTLVFASILAGAFVSLGRPSARQYFGFERSLEG